MVFVFPSHMVEFGVLIYKNIHNCFNIFDSTNILIFQALQLSIQKKLAFRLPISNMVTGYLALKKGVYWPHNELLQWLKQNTTKLIQLAYPFEIELAHSPRENVGYFLSDSIFLNYLTTLTLSTYHAINLSLSCLLHVSIVVVSSSVKKLNIISNCNSGIEVYIYDWLAMFPNLNVFKLSHSIVMDDNCEYDDDKSSCLHPLIQRRQQLYLYEIGNNYKNYTKKLV
ncbi:unnamed protein product [Cunninghamella echinulata]